MKKILTICVAFLLAATTTYAKEYKHSIGMVAGIGFGAQYKTMVTNNFTIIAEFLGCSANLDGGNGMGYVAAPVANGVFAYQANATEGENIKLDWYVGGQAKLGYVLGNAGIFGFGAVGGIEANMTNAPIAFSFDFRPGYGLLFNGAGTGHMFDYSINLGVRHTF